MGKTSRYIAKSFIWGASSMLLDAVIKFVSIPILLNYLGKDNYGLITLAYSINAYLQLLDMGINTGAVKYFSEWIQQKKMDVLDSVARTSITFYSIIGLINALVLIIVSIWGISAFSLSPEQIIIFRKMLLILSLFAVINWSTSVFNQLLTANESISIVQQLNILRSVLSLGLIFLTIHWKLDIIQYFLYTIILNSIIIIPYYIKTKKDKLIKSFLPAFDWKNFSIIFKYSLAIISMGIFQITASRSRPIILSIYSDKGMGIIADYKVMETITLFIISIGGMFSSIFLPKTAKMLADNDRTAINNFAYNGTLYTSIIVVYLCIPFALCSSELLEVYLGESYTNLAPWLNLWIFTILGFLHSTPVHSIILSVGKTRPIVFCTAFSCIVSIIINIFLCKQLGVGSAIIGYSAYILIQMSFYYLYFHEVIGLNSWKIFKAFFKPTFLGVLSYLIIWAFKIPISSPFIRAVVKCCLWAVTYSGCLLLFRLVNLQLIKNMAFGRES